MAIMRHKIKISIEHANHKLDGGMMYTVYYDPNSLIQKGDIVQYIAVDRKDQQIMSIDINDYLYIVTSIVHLRDGNIVFGDRLFQGDTNGYKNV